VKSQVCIDKITFNLRLNLHILNKAYQRISQNESSFLCGII